MEEAVATFEVMAASKIPVDERLLHFQQTYPERLGRIMASRRS